MATEVIMPALEMSQEQGVLVRWLKSEGEFVARGEPLMEIETDKAVMEIEASASGTLSNVTAREGDEVPVGQGIAWLLNEGEAAPPPAVGAPRPQRPSARPGTARRERATKTPARSTARRGRVRATPRARKLARRLGIDLAAVTGTGPKGAILPRDLEAHQTASKKDAVAESEYRVVPIKGTRRSIARRTSESYRNAPHITLTLSLDVSELQARTTPQRRLTPCLLKAVAGSLMKHPRLNAHLVEEEIREFASVHLGVAVSLEDGLVVPVLRSVERKEIERIQTELADLAHRSRKRTLQPEEMKGSTFSVSNLGMYGIEQFTSILNPPEVGILSVGTVRPVPVVVDGKVSVRSRLQVTLNADHRAVDGAVAAQFLQTLKESVESAGEAVS
ncbi:MAG: dihydrolipoamide acetyltransferase family protein [Candidatus Aminicenantes bacterium]|nr:dihydrolipoamide acetyltransferase family protein [Candidatus Aminicenantes bacterium]